MKKLLILFLFLSIIISCGDDEQISASEIVGTWRLTAVFNDPGDGRGSFKSVDSNKTITFFESGDVISNASLCNPALLTTEKGQAVYSLKEFAITPNCVNSDFNTTIYFEFDKENLILNYLCYERCSERYSKE